MIKAILLALLLSGCGIIAIKPNQPASYDFMLCGEMMTTVISLQCHAEKWCSYDLKGRAAVAGCTAAGTPMFLDESGEVVYSNGFCCKFRCEEL